MDTIIDGTIEETTSNPPRCVVLVQAPNIDEPTRQQLEFHILEGMGDPEYTVVTNYSVDVSTLFFYEDSVLLVQADDVTETERSKLHTQLLDPKTRLVVLNYRVDAHYIPRVAPVVEVPTSPFKILSVGNENRTY